MVLFHTMISISAAAATAIVAYIIFRGKTESLWGWIASFFFDLPILWLAPLGVTNLENLMFLSHTIGILIFPIFLVILDVFLIGMALFKYVSWMTFSKNIVSINKLNRLLDNLKKYNAIPMPIRIERVYLVGILAGIIHLAINVIIIGSL